MDKSMTAVILSLAFLVSQISCGASSDRAEVFRFCKDRGSDNSSATCIGGYDKHSSQSEKTLEIVRFGEKANDSFLIQDRTLYLFKIEQSKNDQTKITWKLFVLNRTIDRFLFKLQFGIDSQKHLQITFKQDPESKKLKYCTG